MREILFRGKRTDNGEWVEGGYFHLHKTTYCFYDDGNNDIHRIAFEQMTDWNLPNRHLMTDVLPETVGQYTGLTDNNGKRIFEGDVVITRTTSRKFTGRIEYSTEYVRFVCVTNDDIPFPMDSQFKYEIIGNIHDNPELLEQEDT